MWQKLVRTVDLWSGEMRGVPTRGCKVLLVNIDGEIRAYEDRCAHQAVELSRGSLRGRVLTCSAHEWQYDALSGEGLNPRDVALRRLPVEARDDGWIWVDATAGHGAC